MTIDFDNSPYWKPCTSERYSELLEQGRYGDCAFTTKGKWKYYEWVGAMKQEDTK